LLGELMYQSHASYSACGLGASGTDRLVDLVRQAGPTAQLYGAKITGGGSGGTVAVLARRGSKTQIERITRRYSQETGLSIEVMHGSSHGAVAWGSHRVIMAS
jgi:galactokinase